MLKSIVLKFPRSFNHLMTSNGIGAQSQETQIQRSSWHVLRHLVSYFKPYTGKFTFLLLLLGMSSIFTLIPPFLMRISIDTYIVNADLDGLAVVMISIIIFGIAEGLVGFLQRYIGEYIGQRVVNDMRVQLYSHVNKQSFSFFDKQRTGDIIARVISDTGQLRGFVSFGLVNMISNSTQLVGVIIVVLFWNLYLGLILLILMPFVLTGMYIFTRRITPANKFTRKANSALTSSIQECLNGIREVKLYGREEYMLTVFDEWNKHYYEGTMEATSGSAVWMPYIPFVVSISSSFLFLIGGLFVAQGIGSGITVGMLLAATAYVTMVSRPIQQLTRFLEMFSNARASSERVFDFLDYDPVIKDSPKAKQLADVVGHIEYRDVGFHYQHGNKIISDVNLDIKPGEVIAFVGPSGVGKTTMLHLLPRFYDVTSGAIYIDDVDIRDVTVNSLRKNIGIVMQDTFLFDGTIKDNISFGNTKANQDQIATAARVAQLDDFIDSLPQGFNTTIGERGVKLSGGQAQRLSIARVLLTNPNILILDEPTANVDAVTDKRVMTAVHNAIKGRTTLVIAHRLWTIKNADKIVLLKEGRIEAIGTHQELLKSSAFYKDFFASQFLHEDLEGGSESK
nr:ABC transporter ATP-binding protein [Candidatus Sigynarchaeota archaeon]